MRGILFEFLNQNPYVSVYDYRMVENEQRMVIKEVIYMATVYTLYADLICSVLYVIANI